MSATLSFLAGIWLVSCGLCCLIVLSDALDQEGKSGLFYPMVYSAAFCGFAVARAWV